MIEAATLLKDLKRLLRVLEDDIRARTQDDATTGTALTVDWHAARDAGRTAQTFNSWRDDEVTQAAVHWILACVFLRFVEDNGLVERPFLSGPGERLRLARDRHEAFFRADPRAEERDFLHACFREVAALPGLGPLFADTGHNPLWRLPVSGDGAVALRRSFQETDPDTGELRHDFTDAQLETRFLGDLYQDLSEAAKKRFALLQTPEFVEEFILDRTLEPAIREFGWRQVRMIDPACGSGHFLLGAFRRLFDLWTRNEPARNTRDCAQKALDAVSGVDINPFAAAIARFRLLVSALKACGIPRLRGAPDFRIEVVTGDSLLHGRRFMDTRRWQQEMRFTAAPSMRHVYYEEDREALDRILGRQYHAVVGNPPYITPKDQALNQAYRQRYFTCHMKYSLVVPFMERFADLAVTGGPANPAGFSGMITANSFMKREFGKKLIQKFLPKIDLTHVIDTAGAYIPGHGTPTVIIFARNRPPAISTVRTVMGIKGEPSRPEDPARGLVWVAIEEHIDHPGSESEYVSVAEMPRSGLGEHPWSIGGGGAAELRQAIETDRLQLRAIAGSIGITSFTLEDDVFVRSERDLLRYGVPLDRLRGMVLGDAVRDWYIAETLSAIFPYDPSLEPLKRLDVPTSRAIWPYRTNLSNNFMFGGVSKLAAGLNWYEYGRFTKSKFTTLFAITFAFVATHNHFVFDRGGKVFNRSAPVIKLQAGASADEHLGLIGLLNSSVACFWMKQVFYPKGGDKMGTEGARVSPNPWEDRFEHDATKLRSYPVVADRPIDLARSIDRCASDLGARLPGALLRCGVASRCGFDTARKQSREIRERMIALQEELDWRCYKLYSVVPDAPEHPDPPPLKLGQRAFEIVMARRMAEGELETAWFERHGSTPITELPAHWPADYRAIVERRIQLIEEHRDIRLIERPEYKRRWQWTPWEEREQEALRSWLLDRLEDQRYWPRSDPAPMSTRRLADLARRDLEFMQVAELYEKRADFNVDRLVAELVAAEAVPYLPALRYSDSGLRKRVDWGRTWNLQRQEDAIDARADLAVDEKPALKTREIGDIPVPPKYRPADFAKGDYWRLRGGLDVPKERFVSYPGAESEADGSLVVAWAGYDHIEQAQALGSYYVTMKEEEGWPPERLLPLLAGLRELVPWLKQWHNDFDAASGTRLGDYYEGFVTDQVREFGYTVDFLAEVVPPPPRPRGRRR